MNKTITIYTLLGLIKDGKAPKKIKWGSKIYELKDDRNYFCNETQSIMESDFIFEDLEDEVKILDEKDDFIEIKEIQSLDVTNIYTIKINQLIHNQKILIERLENVNKE